MNKAKRVIKEFDFESEGASVHLVSKEQGGAANGFKTLIKKSAPTVSLEDVYEIDIVKKLEQIKVTMSMEEFLRKFFDMYYDDAELLTAMLGFQTEFEAYRESLSEQDDDGDSGLMNHADYIASKLSSFEIMKSMYEQNYDESVSALDYVPILELQEKLETKLKEEMMDKVSIQKSRLTELEQAETELATTIELMKSVESAKAELEQELDTIKKAQADAQLQAMQDKLKGLVAEDKIERMAKSLMSMDAETASDVIETLEVKKAALEDSNLFEETSIQGEPESKDAKASFEDQLAKALAGTQ